ncbi:MAG: NYN domain-containing protein [Lachnospirales bacterium]
MKKISLGILAHVDAGKTTLSENILFLKGVIRKKGRVDNSNTYLDTHTLEKNRGITIFSKEAVLTFDDGEITLVDTPGHVDFSAEMERTLSILNYAILVINGASGVQSHTKTLWQLLHKYKIPTFIFVNKMDQTGVEKSVIVKNIKEELSNNVVDFTSNYYENIALCNEKLMNYYLEQEKILPEDIQWVIREREIFPMFFGSALKGDGVEDLVNALDMYTCKVEYGKKFSGNIYKISHENGQKISHMKIIGGSLKVKDSLEINAIEEKINEIRIYSGDKYNVVQEAVGGDVCAVTGLTKAKAGMVIGENRDILVPTLKPVLIYKVELINGEDTKVVLPFFKEIEVELPEIKFTWDTGEIKVHLMGEIQKEVLQSIVKSRFDLDIGFGEGTIVYKETIENIVEGVGHFEPLRHYSEVHVLLEPLPYNSNIVIETNCSEDILAKNWQNLVLSHLREKSHLGVLTGSPITGLKITLLAGRAHKKHTEGGDFREATYRAVRHGLKKAKSILLEPYYKFILEIPESNSGRAMTDIQNMCGSYKIKNSKNGITILEGKAPVVNIRNYHIDVMAYSSGIGRLSLSLDGYDLCHNSDEVIESINYDSERDIANPTGSVFCAHGSGFLVTYDEVESYMHIPYIYEESIIDEETYEVKKRDIDLNVSNEEIEKIFNNTFFSNQSKKTMEKKKVENFSKYKSPYKARLKGEEYLIIDGYNIIFAWEDLRQLANKDIDHARKALIDTMSNFSGYVRYNVMVVFDAYRVKSKESMEEYKGVKVVYTAYAQTADEYIERFTHKYKNNYRITVATSDATEQVIIRGANCGLLSARELGLEVKRIEKEIKELMR